MLKGNGSRGETLFVGDIRKIIVEFNCLGIETTTTLSLHIDNSMFSPIIINIRKECSKNSIVDKLADKIMNSDAAYGTLQIIILVIFLLGLLYMIITCFNLCKGKPLTQAVPCGSSIIEYCTGSSTKGTESTTANGSSIDINASTETSVLLLE